MMNQVPTHSQGQAQRKRPVLRISGDRSHPLIQALMDLPAETSHGLIDVIPFDGYSLNISENTKPEDSFQRIADTISQLLEDNGFEEASKFLDCAYDL